MMKHLIAFLTLTVCLFGVTTHAAHRESIPAAAAAPSAGANAATSNAVFHAHPDAAVAGGNVQKTGWLGVCWSKPSQQHYGAHETFDLGITDTEEDCNKRANDCKLVGVSKPWFESGEWRFLCTGF